MDAAYFDNIDFLSEAKDDKTGEKVVEGLEAMGILKIEALTYIEEEVYQEDLFN